MSTYATLAQARAELAAASNDASQDAALMEYLRAITGRIDETYARWRFEPMQETRNQDWSSVDQYSGLLTLDAPLLSAQSIVDGDGSTLVLWDGAAATRAAANVAPEPLNDTPIRALKKLNGQTWQNISGDSGEGIFQITGLWGFRRGYGGAWKSSLDALTSNTAIGATSLPVTDPDDADITGRTPRFSPGQLIKVNDEFMHVTATDGTDNTVTVEPEANGTTAAAHLSGAIIYTWYPEPTIVRATLRWAALMHSRRGNFEQITVDGLGGTTKFPTDMPEEVKNILDQLPMYRRIGAV